MFYLNNYFWFVLFKGWWESCRILLILEFEIFDSDLLLFSILRELEEFIINGEKLFEKSVRELLMIVIFEIDCVL